MKRNVVKYRFYLISLMIVVFLDCLLMQDFSSKTDQTPYGMEKSRLNEEMKVFPIAASRMEEYSFDFVDSWQMERSFGGQRKHEGCDIITSENQRGMYPVVSMTDGIVEKLGWLTLGGYRIGIRSPNGTYYYYAHLESYAEGLAEGSEVLAGQFLGFTGDSGYGEEGTIGQFVVHLHLGIYVPDENGRDQAVNPYPFLDQLRKKVINADYKKP